MQRLGTIAIALGTALGCESSKGVAPAPADDAQWQRYQGTYRYFAEQSVDVTECGARVHQGATSGYVGLLSADSADLKTLIWEGLSCRLPVTIDPAGALHATGEQCQLPADAELRRYNVVGIVLREFTFDAAGKRFTAAGRIERQLDQERRAYCFDLDASVGEGAADAGG